MRNHRMRTIIELRVARDIPRVDALEALVNASRRPFDVERGHGDHARTSARHASFIDDVWSRQSHPHAGQNVHVSKREQAGTSTRRSAARCAYSGSPQDEQGS
jgi:hypothetical protein